MGEIKWRIFGTTQRYSISIQLRDTRADTLCDKALQSANKGFKRRMGLLFCKSAYDIPEDYHKTDYDHKDFGKIKVPSNWQIKGYDIPIYTNFVYPKAVTSKNL